MADRILSNEVEKALQVLQGQEPYVHHYLKQAFECFKAGAYDAAIVMAWSATVAHLEQAINKIGSDVFQYCFRKEYPDRKKLPSTPGNLVGEDDRAFVQVCKQMRFLRVASDDLHRFRERRNQSAHPNNDPAQECDAKRFLGFCLKMVSHPAADVLILDDTLLVEYALESGHSAESIVSLIHPCYQKSAAIKVMEAYLSNSEPEYDALVSVWYRLWDLLPEADKKDLWYRIAVEVVRALKGRNDFRDGEDVARFIVWPVPSQSHLHRDFIARQYIANLKQKVRDGTFAFEHKDFALWLYDKLPDKFQQQIMHLCTRWLLMRVIRGDFDGSDLDFNAWPKERSDPKCQRRFQVIRDAIVRRYLNDSTT